MSTARWRHTSVRARPCVCVYIYIYIHTNGIFTYADGLPRCDCVRRQGNYKQQTTRVCCQTLAGGIDCINACSLYIGCVLLLVKRTAKSQRSARMLKYQLLCVLRPQGNRLCRRTPTMANPASSNFINAYVVYREKWLCVIKIWSNGLHSLYFSTDYLITGGDQNIQNTKSVPHSY